VEQAEQEEPVEQELEALLTGHLILVVALLMVLIVVHLSNPLALRLIGLVRFTPLKVI
jgi:hypothetical protein